MNLFNKLLFIKNYTDTNEISACFKRCLSNNDGEKILKYLSQMTLERAMPSSASDGELRYLEGQRYIVKLILNHSM